MRSTVVVGHGRRVLVGSRVSFAGGFDRWWGRFVVLGGLLGEDRETKNGRLKEGKDVRGLFRGKDGRAVVRSAERGGDGSGVSQEG